MQCVKQEVTFKQYYHDNFTFPERSFRETLDTSCQSLDADELYFDKQYTYDDIEAINDSLETSVIENDFWVKKPKPKPFMKYSPKRYNNNNKNNSAFRKNYGRNSEVISGQENRNLMGEQNVRWISNTRQAEGDANGTEKMLNRPKNKVKNSQNDKPIKWTLPQDNKKVQ